MNFMILNPTEDFGGFLPDRDTSALIAGMDASALDKARILPFVKPGRILEVGCGGGAVLNLLSAAFPDSVIEGIDASGDMVDAARARTYPNPNVSVLRQGVRATMQDGAFALPGGYDTIILCSSLHEIVGPESFPAARERKAARTVVDLAKGLLRPGGRIIVRDGVRPVDGSLRITMPKALAEGAWSRFTDEYLPFDPYYIGIEWSGDGASWTGQTDSWAAYEFLTKIPYHGSEEDWEHEMSESYGVTRIAPFVRALESERLGIVHRETYTVPFLADLWERSGIVLTDAITGEPTHLDSTMIVVAAKDAIAESIRASQKHGRFNSAHEFYGVAAEEWHEVMVALHANDRDGLIAEALQLAAVCLRFVAESREEDERRRRSA